MDIRVVVAEPGAALGESLDDSQRGRLADVADAALVADPEDRDPGAVDRLGHVVQRPLDALDADVRHLLVDLAGELDELSRHVELAGAPGEVERVDGEAVAAHPGAWLEP